MLRSGTSATLQTQTEGPNLAAEGQILPQFPHQGPTSITLDALTCRAHLGAALNAIVASTEMTSTWGGGPLAPDINGAAGSCSLTGRFHVGEPVEAGKTESSSPRLPCQVESHRWPRRLPVQRLAILVPDLLLGPGTALKRPQRGKILLQIAR